MLFRFLNNGTSKKQTNSENENIYLTTKNFHKSSVRRSKQSQKSKQINYLTHESNDNFLTIAESRNSKYQMMLKKKVYYLYFRENDYQKLNDNHLEEVKEIINGSSGSQILTIGMTAKQTNSTEFVVWGESKEEVEKLLNTGIKNVFTSLMNYMEGDLKEGLVLTKSKIEEEIKPIIEELYLENTE